jgi:hypothetical protein
VTSKARVAEVGDLLKCEICCRPTASSDVEPMVGTRSLLRRRITNTRPLTQVTNVCLADASRFAVRHSPSPPAPTARNPVLILELTT